MDREVKTIGGAFLVEFACALEATQCAAEFQRLVSERNEGVSDDDKLIVRAGIHPIEVVHSENDVYGDAVNVASRIEPLAEPGGMCISQ